MTIIDRRFSVAEGQAVKAPCRAATTANITLSGEQTIDGVAVVDGDRVLVKNQSTASQNGIYTVSTGDWSRTRDFDGSYDVVTGTRVYVTHGSVSAGIEYVVATTGAITIDSTSITFTSIGAATVAAAAAAVAAAAAAAVSETNADASETAAEAAAAAAIAAAASVAIASVADRTALKALDTTISKSALLRETGREGTFVWKTGDFSSLIAADTQEGIYVKANAVASSSGSWVRERDDEAINVLWFGSAGYTAAAAAYSLAGTLGTGTVVWPGNTTYDLGANTVTVPDGVVTEASTTAIIRRSADPATPTTAYSAYTGSMIVLGNRCRWSGGVLDNSVVLTQSTTGNTVSAGSKTWVIDAGLPIVVGTTFLLAYSRSNPANKLEGIVTAYNSGTGSLTIASPFPGGTGTWTDWNFNFGAIFQSPMVMHNITGALVEDVRVTGHWYVGITMEAWNSPGPSTLQVSNCVVRRCTAESVQNRGFYIYGNSKGLLIEDCFVDGGSGITDYGINMNAANVSGNANNQQDTRVESCITDGTSAQGITCGDAALYTVINGCTVRSTTGASGVGILVQANVVGVPQYVTVIGCIIHDCPSQGILFSAALYCGAIGCRIVACGNGIVIGPSAGVQSQYISVNSCSAISSTGIGFNVQGNSNRCSLNSISAFTNGTNGVQIDTGASRTLVTGQSNGNSSNNLVDNGTSSVVTDLTVI